MANQKTNKPPVTLTFGHGPKILPNQSLDFLAPGAFLPGTPLNSQTWAESGATVAVESSNVTAIRYDAANQLLYVGFRNSPTYEYTDVPLQVAKDMYDCTSLGSYVHQRLTHHYAYRPLI